MCWRVVHQARIRSTNKGPSFNESSLDLGLSADAETIFFNSLSAKHSISKDKEKHQPDHHMDGVHRSTLRGGGEGDNLVSYKDTTYFPLVFV
ncbi:hypothetical protein PNOK_0317000 [Pyrrhoderma noxium]|uniref:Uncharacterized protein n=1 Tax=Pyrrhoderma noxium TaxID=2282107 RepID=A0A286ULR6_9AGAM|nr:hypothetical protein PNOK_0317000 [Pyrrhoderma noxium]